MIHVQLVTNDNLLRMAFAIRQKVFVEEQNVDPKLEYDQFESISRHFVAFHGNFPVGAARWRHTDHGIKLERFAVIAPYRGKGVGSALLKSAMENIGDPGGKQLYLHAQNQVIPFYEKFGFQTAGDEFEEAGILHHKMIHRGSC